MNTTTKTSKFAIARWDIRANAWMRLSWFSTYTAADDALDRWAARYPNAWVEIIDMATNELVEF
jgi:hypothetical protein